MPYMAVGWFWYMGTLAPVIGFVQVGLQSMADRYTYIPFIGIFIMIAWGVPEALKHVPHKEEILSTAAAVIMLAMMMITGTQAKYWRGSIPLFEHAFAVSIINDTDSKDTHTPFRERSKAAKVSMHNLAAEYSNVGFSLAREGKTEEAINYYQKALSMDPSYLRALNNLETVLEKQGRAEEMIPHYLEALRLNPNDFDIHCNIGDTLLKQGKAEEAEIHFKEALRINPRSFATHTALAVMLAQEGRMDEAVGHFAEAVNVNPNDVGARNNLGRAFIELAARGESTVGRVPSAAGADARRRDAGDVVAPSRSANTADAPAPPEPEGRMGVAGDLCVARRQRCPRIASSSRLDLASQAPCARPIVLSPRAARQA